MSFPDYAKSMRSKLHLGAVSTKALVAIVLLAILAIAICVFTVFIKANDGLDEDKEANIEIIQDESESNIVEDSIPSAKHSASIYVHVAGCVKSPGVYSLGLDSRVNDAIVAAGGFSKKADKEAVNLAQSISDGQQIIIPEKSIPNGSSRNKSTGASSIEEDGAASKNTSIALSNEANGLININTASAEELQALSGIGEAKARKILEYRENCGPFSSVDDLTSVSGIGEKTLESIRSNICV